MNSKKSQHTTHNLDPVTQRCSDCGADLRLTPAQRAKMTEPSMKELDQVAQRGTYR